MPHIRVLVGYLVGALIKNPDLFRSGFYFYKWFGEPTSE